MSICFGCFKEYDEEFGICPYCGHSLDDIYHEEYLIAPGTVLIDRYIIGYAVGSGGFGNVYKAWDKKLETIVAIKEYYPQGMVNRIPGTQEVILVSSRNRKEFEYGKARLLQEARNVAKFSEHKNIVDVFEFFEANNTSYMVMEFLYGMPLNKYLKENGGKLEPTIAVYIVSAICDALTPLHKSGIIHRDISPDNIYICDNKIITLFDFGTAEFPDGKNEIPVIVKPGFAPPEQYESENRQGFWTDIYALGAMLYLLLTGKKPIASTDRKPVDELLAPGAIDAGISETLSNSVMRAMAIDINLRFQNIVEFQKAIQGEIKVYSVEKEKKRRKNKRWISMLVAVAVLFIGVIGVCSAVQKQKEAEYLEPVEIVVSIPGDENSQNYVTMEKIVTLFNEAYPDVTINLETVSLENYEDYIKEQNVKADLPQMFYSTGILEKDLYNATNISSIMDSKHVRNCYFVKDYKKAYSQNVKMPLGVNIPVVYIISYGNNSISYEKDTIRNFSDLETESLSLNTEFRSILDKTMSVTCNGESYEKFFLAETAVLLSSTKDYFNVQAALGGRYKVLGITPTGATYCEFDNEWSIGNGRKDEIKAAKKLLEFMLSSAAQDVFYFDAVEKSGVLPINQKTFDSYVTEIFPELNIIYEVTSNYSFEEKKDE